MTTLAPLATDLSHFSALQTQAGGSRLLDQLTRTVRAAAPDGEPPLHIVDLRALASDIECAALPPRDDGGAPVVALCAAPTAAQRLHLLASGARAILDAERPVGDLLRRLTRLLRAAAASGEPTLDEFDSHAPAMVRVLRDARRTAKASASLLLTGATGAGKEYLARAVHASGPRRDRPFVVLNCGALPENLLESQLFGHERGAFTGADRVHKGLFEFATGGTLLLDEIGEMPLHLQVKLLTVLERREVVRLGAHQPIPVDVRVMAATNRDIDRAVARGAFREDLLYRLNVIQLRLPALAERRADIPDLAGRFLGERCAALGLQGFPGIEAPALAALLQHDWPGNVRELRNALERALVLNGGRRIALTDLPPRLRGIGAAPAAAPAAPPAPAAPGPEAWEGHTLREVREAAVLAAERAFLEHLLVQTGGRIGKTAERAGIRPRSLYDKMQRHGLRKEQFRHRS